MQFLTTASVLALLSTSAYGAVTADQTVANIDALTDLSTQTNDVAKSISVTNFFSTAPQVINNMRQIVDLANKDNTAETSKKTKRQECLNVADVQKCIEDLEEIIEDPSEILGDKKRRGGPSSRRAAPAPFDEAQQLAICDSYHSFETAHDEFLRTLIAKHGLLSLTPFTAPIAQILRVEEATFDTFAVTLIARVPKCATSATQNKKSLDATLAKAIDLYSS